MNLNVSLVDIVRPVLDHVTDETLKLVLYESFIESSESVTKIEQCFDNLPARRWPEEVLSRFFNSWKASHLKMLAIYGLSCRLQRLALAADGRRREQLFLAAARNGETSHEDLGLDTGGKTHADLYDRFAAAFLRGSAWRLEEYCLPDARDFRQWIYHNMVVDDIGSGLLTNIFSEIYNHGEYSLALAAFSELVDRHYDFSAHQKSDALGYISVHVDGDTEVDHFRVVVDALERYNDAIGGAIDYGRAKKLFKEYLARLGAIMEALRLTITHERQGIQLHERPPA